MIVSKLKIFNLSIIILLLIRLIKIKMKIYIEVKKKFSKTNFFFPKVKIIFII